MARLTTKFVSLYSFIAVASLLCFFSILKSFSFKPIVGTDSLGRLPGNLPDTSSTFLLKSKELNNCLEKLRSPNGDPPPLIAVTSVTSPAFAHFKGRNFKNTLWGNVKYLPPLIVYHENTWDVLMGRDPISEEVLDSIGACSIDVFDAAPNLLNSLVNGSMYKTFYSIDGIKSLSDRIMDGTALVRKAVAISHLSKHLDQQSMMLWLDVDVTVSKSLYSGFLSEIRTRDISYIPETDCFESTIGVRTLDDLEEVNPYCSDFRIDTGVFAFRLNPGTSALLTRVLELYDGRMLELAQLCFQGIPTFSFPADYCSKPWVLNSIGLNDIHVFAIAIHELKQLRSGWFPLHDTPVHDDGRISKRGGMCSVPPSRNQLDITVPFFLTRYITHHKGGSAIMARQHEGYLPNKKIVSAKTSDESMLVPEKYNAIETIDPRCACGDKRATFTVASLLTLETHLQCSP